MFEGLMGLGIFLALAFLRVPLAFAMGLVGFVGFAYKVNFAASSAMVAQLAYETGMQYALSVIPLFILMGNLVSRARLTEELFDAAYAFLGHLRGGLAMSTVAACAGFGAICGSSVATSATFARVAYQPMMKFNYQDSMAAGTIAAGGTLGILIPPSVIMVLYGIMTETSIGKLFAAGLLPGLLAVVLFCIAIYVTSRFNPAACPSGARSSWPERLKAAYKVWPVMVLFLVVMGGIYGGLFTATEGAAIGATGGLILALSRRVLSWSVLVEVVTESARTTAMMFMLLIGALIFANFINYTSLPSDLVDIVTATGVSPLTAMLTILAIYIVLGAAMEEVSMILLTVPVFFPLIVKLGFDPVWFGVIIVSVVMLGMVSPPVGMNIFVVRNLLPQVKTTALFRGVMPFVVVLCLLPLILLVFPQLATWLPSFVK
ncbi:TRAP transporter large permease [Hydrogenophaga sp. PBL-H3]|uniref:TRAP transporter large permease n=1 Tax=Hydrogenophaga sp. PBL-H3 TaxID=434010 RepID=UPI00131F5600|nr:TRAP transporter large permease [Hydrogenophaga sp. PBL-H3]QHE78660.1 TRAP transporter large permease [Hydrogenophaga sp. PBL-H3]QHE83085.1 TRAP transporter large permease [Hydrogenophaga sp. PBL-H3]